MKNLIKERSTQFGLSFDQPCTTQSADLGTPDLHYAPQACSKRALALMKLSKEKSERLKAVSNKANRLLRVELIKQLSLKQENIKDARRMDGMVKKSPLR